MLIALNISHPKDIKPVEEWVRVHADDKAATQMIVDLPTLPKGVGWIWSPSWLEIFRKVKIRRRRTFDSGATPEVGRVRREPRQLARVDVAALSEEIGRLAEEVKANDPAVLKKRITELERQLKGIPAPVADRYQEGRLFGAKQAIDALASLPVQLQEYVLNCLMSLTGSLLHNKPSLPGPKMLRMPKIAPNPVAAAKLASTASAVGTGGLRRILVALSQRPGLTNRQIGVRAGLSSKSGTFTTYMGRARSAGWIRDEGDRRFLTGEGEIALGDYTPLPCGVALFEYWCAELGSGGLTRILRALVKVYPAGMTGEELGAAADISHTSGTFTTYMGRLRRLELIEGKGTMRASAELFD